MDSSSPCVAKKLGIAQSPDLESLKGNDGVAREEVLQDNEELVNIDYTPVRKKTPIHNHN